VIDGEYAETPSMPNRAIAGGGRSGNGCGSRRHPWRHR
jgi:hypothetical protein